MMDAPDQCQLHEAVVVTRADQTETLLQLARSPIGDECQRCPVCRLARKYIDRRLAERVGQVFPPDQNGDAVWRQLQAALDRLKSSTQRTS